MRGEVGAARLIEHCMRAMTVNRLQRVAKLALEVAVIDEERGAALARDLDAQGFAERCRGGAKLCDGAILRLRQLSGKQARLRVEIEGQAFAVAREGNASLMPCPARALELTDRQRVEEFIGDEQHRTMRQSYNVVVKHRRESREFFLLHAAQHGAALDEMQTHSFCKARHVTRRAQRVNHHRAATGPELDEQHRVRRAEALPVIRAPRADQLAENLADLRRGDEIARGAERVARRVVESAHFGHVIGDADRSRRVDPARQTFEERVYLCGFACHRVQTPRRKTGTESNCPMVAPNHKYPMNESGSRKNSTTIRARA